jgi:hypothetical protein
MVHVISKTLKIQFNFNYVPSQQLQGQLEAQHSAGIGNYIMDKYNIKTRLNNNSIQFFKSNNSNSNNNNNSPYIAQV